MVLANKRSAILLIVLVIAVIGYFLLPHYYASKHQQEVIAAQETQKSLKINEVKKEAEQGNAAAQNLMGNFYKNGEVVTQDLKQAYDWYSQAASKDNPDAQNSLGSMYVDGEGVEENYTVAMEWFQKSANHNHPLAFYNIGHLYLLGLGVPQDKSQAIFWMQKAADKGLPLAESFIGLEYLKGTNLSQDYQKAFYYLDRAALKDDGPAQLAVANMYFKGLFVEKDFAKAGEFYGLAIKNIPEESKTEIKAFLALHAKKCLQNVKPDGTIIYDLDSCFLASSTNDSAVLHAVGLAYFAGDKSVHKDLKKAFDYFLRSAKAGNPNSQIHLAIMFDENQGFPQDLVEAYAWYSAAETYPDLADIQKKLIQVSKKTTLKNLGLLEDVKAKAKAQEYINKYGFK